MTGGVINEHHHYTVTKLTSGAKFSFGTMVWSAGLSSVKLVHKFCLELLYGRVIANKYLRTPEQKGSIITMRNWDMLVDGTLPTVASVS